jgi:hypothetical protein
MTKQGVPRGATRHRPHIRQTYSLGSIFTPLIPLTVIITAVVLGPVANGPTSKPLLKAAAPPFLIAFAAELLPESLAAAATKHGAGRKR